MHVVDPPLERSIPDALALACALLAAAQHTREVHLAASVVRGPAVVLGARQHARRVVDLAACARDGVAVFRRRTSGTAAFAGGTAVLFSLALPHVAALAPDAQGRTLLNRNVRGFLHGFTRAGALAHYFGREWIAVQHRPAALLGFDIARDDGAVLVELIAGFDAPAALPPALATPRERATDRYRGREPIALGDALPPARRDPFAFAQAVTAASAERWKQPVVPASLASLAPFAPPARDVWTVADPDDVLPAGARACEPVPCPIGWIDRAVRDAPDAATSASWLGGDALAPGWLLDAVCAALDAGEDDATVARLAEGPHVAVEGTRIEELIAAAREALAAEGRA